MEPLFQFLQAPGPHAVSLEVAEQFDASRPGLGLSPTEVAAGRPLQTLVWRPAEPGDGPTVTVGDYLDLWAAETRFGRPSEPQRAREWRGAMTADLEQPMWARRGARPAPGRFPILVYAPSFSSTAWENADLCEYLASHGFIVVASACMGAQSRDMTADLAGLSAQAADISFLAGFAQGLEHADPERVAVAGFSWGGLSNLVAAARDPRIKALVCLDGSLRYWPGLLKRFEDVRPERMTIPLISFAKADWSLEQQARLLSPAQIDGPNIFNAWRHGDRILVRMPGMTHRQFSSMFQRSAEVREDFDDPTFVDGRPNGRPWRDGWEGYGWTCRYVLEFLRACLCEDMEAAAFLRRTPGENGVPDRCLLVELTPGSGLPVSWPAFRASGLGRLEALYDEILRACPDFALDAAQLAGWVHDLLDEGRTGDALEAARFNQKLHPEAAGAHSLLGRVLELSGAGEAAAEAYRTALRLCDFDALALRGLRRLSPGAQA